MSEKVPEQARKPAKRRWRIVLVLCALVVAVAAVAFWPGEMEPEYEGKSLSYWIKESERHRSEKETKQASEAVRQIGTNGLPLLLKWLQYEPQSAKGVSFMVGRLPSVVTDNFVMQGFLESGRGRNYEAMMGFRLLGTHASPAIDELAGLVSHPSVVVASSAVRALGYIGEPAYPVLKTVVTDHKSAQARMQALFVMGLSKNLGTNTVPAVVLFSQALNDTNAGVAGVAVFALVQFPEHTDIALPALVKCLTMTNKEARLAATRSLGAFGRKANAAVEGLVTELNDPDTKIRRAATNALLRIAPEVLKTNGVSGGHE